MKSSRKLFAIFIFSFICFSFLASLNDKHPKTVKSGEEILLPVNSKKLDANNISTWFRNNGSFNRDPSTGNSGFEWLRGSGDFARYASGIWMGCVRGNDTLTAVAEYAYDYLPGYIDNNCNPQGANDSLYRIYLITRGDTTSYDYLHWPVNQGAYVNSNGRPFFLGYQTMFYSYTDGYGHFTGKTSLETLKAVILQTNWNYINIGLQDVVFSEFRVINRCSTAWNNTYLSFWTDDDLGDAVDDAVGCDTTRNLGYTYNVTNNDPQYGDNPPAVGTVFLRTPYIFTGNNSDTVRYYHPPGTQNLITKVGYKFLKLNIFNTYNNGFPQPSDPLNNIETYRVLEGLWRLGDKWINPITSQPTTQAYSGDPVTGTGWIMSDGNDRRFLQSVGPFTVPPGDTQSVIIAQVIARGNSNLNSITKLRELSDYVKQIYANNFQSVLSVKNISNEVPDKFILYQNYPNPFNPTTKIKFDIPSNVKRDKSNVRLIIYDVLGKEVQTLINQSLSAGKYEVEWDALDYSNGVYFYSLDIDGKKEVKSMVLLK